MQPFASVGVARAISPDVRYGILPSLTPRKLRFGILPALACEAGEMARATPPPYPLSHKSPGREPGDCGWLGHPAIHAIPTHAARIDTTA